MALFRVACGLVHYVCHTLEGDLDREGWKQINAAVLVAFPEVRYTLDDIIAEGDKVAARWTLHGTHKEEFNGIPATNNAIALGGIYLDRFVDGRIVETWMFYDSLSLLKQLGVAPV